MKTEMNEQPIETSRTGMIGLVMRNPIIIAPDIRQIIPMARKTYNRFRIAASPFFGDDDRG
jgi:hypothetical protein